MIFMKILLPILVCCFLLLSFPFLLKVHAQQKVKDNLHYELSKARTGKDSILLLNSIELYSSKDSAIYYNNMRLKIAQRLGDESSIIEAKMDLGFYYRNLGDYAKAIQIGQERLQDSEVKRDTLKLLRSNMLLYFCYGDLSDTTNRRFYLNKSLAIYDAGFINRIKDADEKSKHEFIYNNYQTGRMMSLGKIDSAIYYTRINLERARQLNEKQWIGISASALASFLTGDSTLALMQESWKASLDGGRFDNAGDILLGISNFYKGKGQSDSALHYSKLALQLANTGSIGDLKLKAYRKLFELYKPINKDSAYQYLESWSLMSDSLFGKEEINRIQSLNIKERSRLEAEANKLLNEQQRKAANNRFLFLIAATFLLLAIAVFFYQNNRQRKKSHHQLEMAYDHLKSTQAQLIQSEKLASLGELTAGIAHEIQNPLNFVNNFSELSVELIDELKSPLTPEGGIKPGEKIDMEIFSDLSQNLEKITLHGKRASSIVKGMLEHSRASTGVKELTDINAMADEYLRLAYHGLRAKDKDFNSDFKTDFDPNLPKIAVIPQDIGRVLLNLINNAFWAVKTVDKPLVVVKTEQSDNQIIIKVSDNGTGMTDEVKAKIFQPFFTTKPTGQGAGLGLSLAYDIITKGHAGTIEVASVEGEGTTFVVKLPIIRITD